MKPGDKFFVANIVLGTIFVIFLAFSILLSMKIHSIFQHTGDILEIYRQEEDSWWMEEDGSSYYEMEYSIPKLESITTESLGSEYQGKTAEEGYSFYSVKATIHNAGTSYVTADYLYLWIDGEDYDDVFEEYEEDGEEYDPLIYANNVIIPAGQTSEVERLIQVQEGIEEVTVTLYRDWDSEEGTVITVPLEN